MKQTSLQHLIEWGDKMMEKHPLKVLSFAEAIDKAAELLELEKEQIIDSFDEGKSDGYKTAREWDEMILWSSAEQYYNETYGGDK